MARHRRHSSSSDSSSTGSSSSSSSSSYDSSSSSSSSSLSSSSSDGSRSRRRHRRTAAARNREAPDPVQGDGAAVQVADQQAAGIGDGNGAAGGEVPPAVDPPLQVLQQGDDDIDGNNDEDYSDVESTASSASSLESRDSSSSPKKGIEYKFTKKDGKKVMTWLTAGLSKSEAKKCRNRYRPKFKGGFNLHLVYDRLRTVRSSHDTKERIDPVESELRSLTFKWQDLARTLFFIWKKSSDARIRRAAKVAVKQWSHASFSILDSRRKNLLKQTNPSFVSLLKRSKNFDKNEHGFLFGDHFIGKMVRAARLGAALNDANGRVGGHRGNSGRGGGRGSYGGTVIAEAPKEAEEVTVAGTCLFLILLLLLIRFRQIRFRSR